MNPEFHVNFPAEAETTRVLGVHRQSGGQHPALAPEVSAALLRHGPDASSGRTMPLILQGPERTENILLADLDGLPDCSPRSCRRFGGMLADALRGHSSVLFRTEDVFPGERPDDCALLHILAGYCSRQYSFDRYRAPEKACPPQRMFVEDAGSERLAALWLRQGRIVEASHRVRQMVSEPPNVLYPESMAAMALQLRDLGLVVDVLDERELRRLGMGALLGVGQGSDRPPRLVLLRWQGHSDPAAPPVAVAGKGITFDSGGLSLKTRPNMRGMKHDMAGAAVVLELLRCAAETRLPINVAGILALAENMPSGKALRPDDIIRTLSGRHVEIVSADAEGRMVLCDALSYAVTRLAPSCLIDIATLTGAMSTALGWQKAGLFSNDDRLAEALFKAGEETDERLWRMPMDEDYDTLLKTGDADLENATFGQNARSIFAAKFLEQFVDNTPWAHIDIAGTAWSDADTPMSRRGATGFGLQLLYRFLEKHAPA